MTAKITKKTQAERRAQAEQKLFKAAIHLTIQYGHNGYSLAEVGKLAGFSRGLPAHYFGSKSNFQQQLIQFMIAEFKANQPTLESHQSISSLSLTRSISRAFEMSDKDAIFIRILLIVLSDKSGNFSQYKELTTFRQQTIDSLEQDIILGIKNGTIRKNVNPKMTSLILVEAICSVIKLALSDPNIDIKTAGEELIQLILHGISI